NPRLIDPQRLDERDELPRGIALDGVCDEPLEAYRSFARLASPAPRRAFAALVRKDRARLLPYGLFELLRRRFGDAPWWEWPDDARRRSRCALRRLLAKERERFRSIAFRQYLFELSWFSLKRYANARGVYLFGDLPFYV